MSCGATVRFEIRAGDLLPILEVPAEDIDGPDSLTGWTGLNFKMVGPARTVTAAAAVDATGKILRFVWPAGSTDAPGVYEGYFYGTSPAPESKQQTFPTKGYILVEVVRR